MLWDRIYDLFGSLICHQIPGRSIVINGRALPVCARDTGIYVGMFIVLLYLAIRRRWKCDKPPRLSLSVVLCIFIIPMGLDGITSYLGLRPTNNMIRIFTGGWFGMAIPFFLMPVANFKIYSTNRNPSLISYKEIAFIAILVTLVCIVIYAGFIPNWWIISTIIVATIVFMFYRLCYTIVSPCNRLSGNWKTILSILFEVVVFGILLLFRLYVYPVIAGIQTTL